MAEQKKIRKEGYISKKGAKVKNWKKRYLVIETDKLSYFEDESMKSKKGEILHKNIKKVQQLEEYGKGKTKKKYIFSIETHSDKSDRTYFIQATDESSRRGWIEAVQALIYEAFVDAVNEAQGSELGTRKLGVEDFEQLKLIGRGGFGRVLLVKKKENQQIYAMKILKKKFVVEQNQVTHTTTERNVMVKLEHPFLTKLHFAFQDDKSLYFVMDFINGGELFHHLRREKKFSEDRTRFYAAEIISALTYLHTRGIVYRDLKPENVLLGRDGHVVVTDFGLAKEGLHDNERTETRAGTPEYLAPEVIKGEKYTKSVDWWAVGILVYEMLTGAPPFIDSDIQKLFQKITGGDIKFPDYVSQDAADFVSHLLARDTSKRLADPVKIKSHSWFKSTDWEKLDAKAIQPPFVPKVSAEDDLTQIDPEFLQQPIQDDEDPGDVPAEKKVPLNDLFIGFTFIEK
jgi:serine/threonine protein kinase